MRPRKRILLVGENEERVGCLRFLLDINLFAVTSVYEASCAAALLDDFPFDLLIVDLPLSGASALFAKATTLDIPVRTLVIVANKNQTSDSESLTDAIVLRDLDNSLLLERIKILTVRKRGRSPRKPVALVRPAPAVEIARTA